MENEKSGKDINVTTKKQILKKIIELSNDYYFIVSEGKIYTSEGYASDIRLGEEFFDLTTINERPKEKYVPDNNVGKWIPVSERLPENGQACLATIKGMFGDTYSNTYYEVITYSNNLYKIDEFDFYDKKNVSGFYNYDSEYGYYEVTDVIAWMPLPKAYTESEVEE